jgi:hypothetical protein
MYSGSNNVHELALKREQAVLKSLIVVIALMFTTTALAQDKPAPAAKEEPLDSGHVSGRAVHPRMGGELGLR